MFLKTYMFYFLLAKYTVISAVNLNSSVIVNILFTLMEMIILSPNMTFSFEV